MSEILTKINAEKIIDPKNPMRSEIDRDGIWQLAESIKREGLINPITVRPVGDKFEVVAGHRRFMACKLAGVFEITCVVRELSDDQTDEIMAHENLERQDVDVIEEALLIGRLVGENEGAVKETAKRLNRSVTWIESRLELLTYPDFMIAAIKEGNLTLGVAHWIFLIEDIFWREQYTRQACQNGMTVLQAQYLHNLWKAGGSPPAEVIIPQAADGATSSPQKALAACAACGKPAEHPNLQMLWTHVECPKQDEPGGVPPENPAAAAAS